MALPAPPPSSHLRRSSVAKPLLPPPGNQLTGSLPADWHVLLEGGAPKQLVLDGNLGLGGGVPQEWFRSPVAGNVSLVGCPRVAGLVVMPEQQRLYSLNWVRGADT